MRALALAFAATVICSVSGQAATIGVSIAQFDDNFLTGVRQAMEAEAAAKGVAAQFEDAQDDTTRQISQIQNFIARKVDAIIVTAVDTSATPEMTRLAVAAKIPLVYVNRRPEEKALAAGTAFVGSDEMVSGTLEGQELAKCLSGKGNVVLMEGKLSNNATLVRTADIEAVAAANPGMRIIQKQTANWDRNQALDLMNNWITGGEKIDGVAANNDEMAIGAILALKQAGIDPKTVCIGGIDATADGLAAVASGDLHVTVFQNAKGQGKEAVDTALRMVAGEAVPPYVDIPYEKVTRENYKQYLGK